MKIVHIVAGAPYNDNWGYQDNLLPKYHSSLGHEVTVLVCNEKHENGKTVKTPCGRYRLEDGVEVIRLKRERIISDKLTMFFSKLSVRPLLEELKPNLIFCHGLCSCTVLSAIRYQKKIDPSCIIVQDNHMDYYNGIPVSSVSGKLQRSYYRLLNKYSQKYMKCIFGVTPWRMTYAEEFFRIRTDRLKLLVMGGDDDQIRFSERADIRRKLREENGIIEDDFLLVSGGKIDRKKQILELMQAVIELDEPKIHLLLFGEASSEVAAEFQHLALHKRIHAVGWIQAERAYDYFLASDLAVFPGSHSVLWEQACACGIPGLFRDWEGMHHVDVGGNCLFLQKGNVEELKRQIMAVYSQPSGYRTMKLAAEEHGIDMFSYRQIAQRAIIEAT